MQGIKIDGRAYAGGWFDWLTPFSLLTGVSVVVGYALLGAAWLIMKTEGHVQERAYTQARILIFAMLAVIALVSAWTPFLNPRFLARWFSWPSIVYVAPVPILTVFAAYRLVVALRERRDQEPFVAVLALFLLCYAGLGISMYPTIVPPGITIWDAAAPDTSLMFLLVGAVVLVPMILAYTAYSYWVFRGKVAEGGYH